jgi:Tol biopolymer transport system component
MTTRVEQRHGRSIVGLAVVIVAFLISPSTANAAFPGDNGLLAFVRQGERRGIYTIQDLGLVRLTSGVDYRPRWSPDGARIVFQRFNDGHSDVFVMDADGSHVLQLTHRGGFQPGWSPDGDRIVFGSARDGDEDIFVMKADGTEETKLTHNRFDEVLPAWSPDGTSIAFSSRREGNADIYLMAPDGSAEKRITRNARIDLGTDWAPGGRRLVFQSNRHHNWDLYTMRLEGHRLTRLTWSTALEWAPAWSPDGTKIAFTLARYRRNVEDIVILDLISSDRLRITLPHSSEIEPNWRDVVATFDKPLESLNEKRH